MVLTYYYSYYRRREESIMDKYGYVEISIPTNYYRSILHLMEKKFGHKVQKVQDRDNTIIKARLSI